MGALGVLLIFAALFRPNVEVKRVAEPLAA
jgi:hypothetical protein